MQQVILDTNMLLVPGQFKVDIFSELDRVMDGPYEILVPEGVLKELDGLVEKGKADDRRAARLAKLLLEHQRQRDFRAAGESRCKGLKIISQSNGMYVDDAILEFAEDGTLVATNDAALKRRLLERGVRVIYLKQRQYLMVSA